MLNIKDLPTAELRGVLKATESSAGRDSELATTVRRELDGRGWSMAEYIDRQSAIYLIGTLLAAAGIWRGFGDGFGLIAGGALLILPILIPLIPRRPIITPWSASDADERPRARK